MSGTPAPPEIQLLNNPIGSFLTSAVSLAALVVFLYWAARGGQADRWLVVWIASALGAVMAVLNVVGTRVGVLGGLVYQQPIFMLAILFFVQPILMFALILLWYRWVSTRTRRPA